MPDTTDPAATLLSPIRERQALASDTSLGFSGIDDRRDALVKSCYEDVPRLLEVVEAALQLAGEWDRSALCLDGTVESVRDCGIALREAITARLTGEEAGRG
jgi:hypothetical protein